MKFLTVILLVITVGCARGGLEVASPGDASTGFTSWTLESAMLAPKLARPILPFWHDYPWKKVPQAVLWTRATYAAIGSEGQNLIGTVPGDADLFCPAYSQLSSDQRKIFWTRLISVLVEKESTFDPAASNLEEWAGPDHHSRGLLQLSIESIESFSRGCPMVKNEQALHQPLPNLQCGVRFMNWFLASDRVIAGYDEERQAWRGLSRYWAPFRDQALKTASGRAGLRTLFAKKRAQWRAEARSSVHQAAHDKKYRDAGEGRLERFMRVLSQIPFCDPRD